MSPSSRGQVRTDFLGSGWAFPVARVDPQATKRLAAARGEEKIRQAIWLILSTAPGERVMRPDFGCGIHDLVFSINDASTAGRVRSLVKEALLRWEPRIETGKVDAAPQPGQPGCLVIEIHYRIRATNARYNLVYPFYLD